MAGLSLSGGSFCICICIFSNVFLLDKGNFWEDGSVDNNDKDIEICIL